MGNARKTCSFVAEWKSRWEPEMEAIGYNGTTCDPTRVDPKVLHWVKENCKDVPHFVKIINSNAAHGKPGLMLRNSSSLTVLSPFVRQHFRKLERVVTLENEAGTRKWRVSFGAPKRDPQWLQGWDRVAADNNFQPGHVVVFVLLENSRFRFTHFDATGINLATLHSGVLVTTARCSSQGSHDQPLSVEDTTVSKTLKRKRALESANAPIFQAAAVGDDEVQRVPEAAAGASVAAAADPCCKERRRNSSSEEEGKRDDSDDDDDKNNNGGRSVMLDESLDPMRLAIMSKRRATTVAENQRALDAAMAHALSVTTPHFVAVMTDTQVYHDFHLVVPESFLTRSCLPTTTVVTPLLLEDGTSGGGGNGQAMDPADAVGWEMLMKKNKYNEVAFHRKLWAPFALHHLLEEGDVCVFHLKQNQTRTIVVHTFRVVPISDHTVSPHHHYALQELPSATEPRNPRSRIGALINPGRS